jgi:hypothetical protein
MGGFARRITDERGWVARVPECFSLQELAQLAGDAELHAALGWLYDAIERGRIEPFGSGRHLRYRFVGERRATDQATMGLGSRP